jgi:hypothetical protein
MQDAIKKEFTGYLMSAPIFASNEGYLYIIPVTSVPSFIFEVNTAKKEIVVQPSSIGS